MKVLKFGGTSVGSVESMSSVKHIVESCQEPVIVVVSALGGITDKLIGTAKIAVEGGNAYEHGFREIVDRHIAMIHGAVDSRKRDELLSLVEPLLDELGNIFKGVSLIKDLSVKTPRHDCQLRRASLLVDCQPGYRRGRALRFPSVH